MGDETPDGPKKDSKYGVRLIRGPFVLLPPHPEECDEDASSSTLQDSVLMGIASRPTCSAGPVG